MNNSRNVQGRLRFNIDLLDSIQRIPKIEKWLLGKKWYKTSKISFKNRSITFTELRNKIFLKRFFVFFLYMCRFYLLFMSSGTVKNDFPDDNHPESRDNKELESSFIQTIQRIIKHYEVINVIL